jgi:hypothetical protein
MPNRFENCDLARSGGISGEVRVSRSKVGAKSFDEAPPMTRGNSECAILRQLPTEWPLVLWNWDGSVTLQSALGFSMAAKNTQIQDSVGETRT